MSDDDGEDYDLDLDLDYGVTLHPMLWRVLVIGGVIAWSAICGVLIGLLN